MNKTELIAALAEKAEVSKKDAEKVLNAFVETVQDAVKADDKVQLVGFGTFESKARAAREGKNPQTGEKIKIAACKVPAFKAGKAFKDLVK
ncbi:MAG: HU family DNA-binding protein [Oscillospiraceae bacterium]|nr:HU family DNA-binding protein [Oscillospiraceae bacterium]